MTSPILTGAVGVLISAGVVGLVVSFLGYDIVPQRRVNQGHDQPRSFEPTRALASVVAFILALVLIKHPIFAVVTAIGTYVVWGELGSKRETKEMIARENAAIVWMEAVAAGLRHSHMNVAIESAGEYAEPEIKEHAQDLARNLAALPLDEALTIFANKMQSRPIDSVAAVLSLVASHGGRKVSELILLEASAARERAQAIAEIAQAQINDRITVRQVLAVTMIMALGIPLISTNVMSWYDTTQGHIALSVIGAGFIWCLRYMVVLSRVPEPPRFFFGTPIESKLTEQAAAHE